jgi:LuxR family maltose regulon positive regulatory protein
VQQHSLLQTKLYIPPIRRELVSRPRLVERLNAGLNGSLTLVSAPAGFGKTTLVSEWVDHLRSASAHEGQSGCAVAWLSLDESDNDPTRFLVYLIAALQTIGPRQESATEQKPVGVIGQGALDALQSPQPSPPETILTSLINEITAFPDRILLVLDDYHLIEAQPIHDGLTFLLEHLPPHTGPGGQCQGMHLVIATRDDPHLPLARLRARGQLTEVRAADMRFSSIEAAEFLKRVMGLDLSAEDIAALEARTEGWIAGLQLAGLALQGSLSTRGREDISGFIRAFAGDNRYIVDYLVEEVLQRQPEGVRSFLLQTSILDRLSGPLCDAVRFGKTEPHSTPEADAVLAETPTAQQDGKGMLEVLEHGNLFVVPLDDKRQWYRYHHLFADVLRAHLMEEQPLQVPVLHRRASEWYEHNGSPSDAIRHALAARDFERAADLAELGGPLWTGGGLEAAAWLGWVRELPEDLVRARPVLSVAYAEALLSVGELEAAETRLRDAERWLEPTTDMGDRAEAPPAQACPERPAPSLSRGSRGMVVVDDEQFRSLPASLASTRAYHALAIGDVPGTVKYAQRALDLLPEGDHYWRAALTTLLGLTYWASGDLVAAHRIFAAGLNSMERVGNIADAISGTFVLADIKMTLGHLGDAASAYEHAAKLETELGKPMPLETVDLYTGMSALHREQGDLEAAAQDLATSKKLGEQVEMSDWQYRWFIAQARLKETQGDMGGALELLDEAERLYVRTPLPDVRPIAALKARVWIKQGRLAEAQSWARERGLSVDDDLRYLREFEHITLARMLIARYENDRVEGSIHEAVELLERLLQAAEEGGRRGSVIEILALQALALDAQGNIPHAPTVLERALEPLEQALALAEPEGYVRLFVDEGTPMARLLYEALSRGIAPDYVRRLLAAVPVTEPEQAHPATPKTPKTEWVEPLSERELEGLQLIAKGLANQEIASKLFLSLNTVKVHTRNIYGKLSAHHRAEAVARARALGILPST